MQALLTVSLGAAGAATITVTNLNDSGAGSLRQAIADAAVGETIQFSVTGTILLTGGALTISQDLVIEGPPTGVVLDGNAATEVFNITAGTVSISDLTITNGNGSAGGGIVNVGNLTLSSSTISNSDASNGEGGGILNVGTLTLVNSTISGNTAFAGGGIANRQNFTVTILNSTISNNSASDHAGGIRNNGGTVNLTNSILGANSAPTGADCTGSPTSAGHNLIGNNDGCNITSATGDLIGNGGAPLDPLLGPLANNSGPTFTHALLAGSPAVGAGDDSAAPTTDQRGVSRPQGAASDIGSFEREVVSVPIPSLSVWGLLGMTSLLAPLLLWKSVRRRRPVRS